MFLSQLYPSTMRKNTLNQITTNLLVLTTLCISLSLMILLQSCQAPSEPCPCDEVYTTDDNGDVKALKDYWKKIRDDYNRKEFTSFTDAWAEDMKVLQPGFVDMPVDSVKSYLNTFYAQQVPNWESMTIEDIRVSGNLAVVRYVTDYGYTSVKTGETTFNEGIVEVIVHQKDKEGNWKILYQASVYPQEASSQEEH